MSHYVICGALRALILSGWARRLVWAIEGHRRLLLQVLHLTSIQIVAAGVWTHALYEVFNATRARGDPFQRETRWMLPSDIPSDPSRLVLRIATSLVLELPSSLWEGGDAISFRDVSSAGLAEEMSAAGENAAPFAP